MNSRLLVVFDLDRVVFFFSFFLFGNERKDVREG